jgi:trk system potassium uptake protein TrkA
MRKQYGVLGLGRFGMSMAKALAGMGHEVLAVDISEAKVNQFADQLTQAVQADVENEDCLRALGLRNLDAVVVAIGEDIKASIITVVTLQEIGVKKIVAKAKDERHGLILKKLGVDKVIFPERDMGIRTAQALVSSSFLDQIQLSPDYSILEVKSTPKIWGQSIGKLNLRAKIGINVLAIKKQERVIVAPGADAIIEENDILVVLGDNKAIEKFDKYL